jgi:AraC-like DNA-binding protein
MMESGAFDAQTVAGQLGIDRRTLNRRLAREGESFSSVLQRIRVEVTCRAAPSGQAQIEVKPRMAHPLIRGTARKEFT